MADAVDLGRFRQPLQGNFLPGVTMRFNGTPLDPTVSNAFCTCRLSKSGETSVTKDSKNGASEVIVIDGPAGQVRFVFALRVDTGLTAGIWDGQIVYEKTDDAPPTVHHVAKFTVEFYEPDGGSI